MQDHHSPPSSTGQSPDDLAELHSLMDEAEANRAGVARQETPPATSADPATRSAAEYSAHGWRPVHYILFVLTCASTFLTGMLLAEDPVATNAGNSSLSFADLNWPSILRSGAEYSLALMAILFFHEMGHYLQARRYRVAASAPYFIPMPLISPFGTMGAVIVQRSGFADRKKLFDIAISGPLAGLIIALPVTWYGIAESRIIEIPAAAQGHAFGEPLIFKWISDAIHGARQPGEDLLLTPLSFAGWVGIFITALNLIPIGQLDGGHVLYSLIGQRAHRVAAAVVAMAIAYMVLTDNYVYVVLLGLIILTGIRHPPTGNDQMELGRGRVILGWLTLAFIVIGFTPVPIQMMNEEPKPRQESQQPETVAMSDLDAMSLMNSSSHSGEVCSNRTTTIPTSFRFRPL